MNKIKSFYAILFILFSSLLFNCKQNSLPASITITSPYSDWSYTDDTLILFSCDSDSKKILWESSIDGIIGNGNQIIRFLTFGQHTIIAKDLENNVSDSICISVIKNNNISNELNLIPDLPFYMKNNESNHNYGIISLDGSAKKVSLSYSTNNHIPTYASDIPKRDFSINGDIHHLKPFKKTLSRNISNDENSKLFYVANTAYIGDSYHEIQAIKYYQGDKISVWLPKDTLLDNNCINSCIEKIEKLIIPRVNILWGACADIDSDGTVSILFCPTINKEQKAVGFFNSKDFYKRNIDTKSKSYNPYSNESDLIYIAIPDESNNNYTINSILATIAHEYTHAVNYSNKTWKKLYAGINEVNQEEVFLDEGWSHLTESLCGFGSSGGNSSFVNYYLNNPALYSFCKADYLGNSDSVGQRGAITLFLYWLFIKAGGMEYGKDGIQLIDKGGISFLKSMISSKNYGWACIGEYFKRNTNSLFLEFSKELLSLETSRIFDQNIKDPISKEKIFECNNLHFYIPQDSFNILPWSITPFTPFPENAINTINGEKITGTVYLFYSK